MRENHLISLKLSITGWETQTSGFLECVPSFHHEFQFKCFFFTTYSVHLTGESIYFLMPFFLPATAPILIGGMGIYWNCVEVVLCCKDLHDFSMLVFYN